MQYIEKTKRKNETAHSGSTVDSTTSAHKCLLKRSLQIA